VLEETLLSVTLFERDVVSPAFLRKMLANTSRDAGTIGGSGGCSCSSYGLRSTRGGMRSRAPRAGNMSSGGDGFMVS